MNYHSLAVVLAKGLTQKSGTFASQTSAIPERNTEFRAQKSLNFGANRRARKQCAGLDVRGIGPSLRSIEEREWEQS